MKEQLYCLYLIGFFLSCSNNNFDESKIELVGSWKLIEVLADPGNGGGTFQAVNSNKTIEFKNDGIVMTNTSLCEPHSDEIIRSGSYSLSDGIITTNCQNPNIATISFELVNQFLILDFISNEGYSQKFQKVD